MCCCCGVPKTPGLDRQGTSSSITSTSSLKNSIGSKLSRVFRRSSSSNSDNQQAPVCNSPVPDKAGRKNSAFSSIEERAKEATRDTEFARDWKQTDVEARGEDVVVDRNEDKAAGREEDVVLTLDDENIMTDPSVVQLPLKSATTHDKLHDKCVSNMCTQTSMECVCHQMEHAEICGQIDIEAQGENKTTFTDAIGQGEKTNDNDNDNVDVGKDKELLMTHC